MRKSKAKPVETEKSSTGLPEVAEINQEPEAAESAKITIEAKVQQKYLKCDLTQADLDMKMQQLSEIVTVEIPRVDGEKKLATRQYKVKLDGLQGRACELANAFKTKTEMRLVDCIERYNPNTKKVDTIRLDNDRFVPQILKSCPDKDWEIDPYYEQILVSSRDLEECEIQTQLDLVESQPGDNTEEKAVEDMSKEELAEFNAKRMKAIRVAKGYE